MEEEQREKCFNWANEAVDRGAEIFYSMNHDGTKMALH
jgi:hypothetical protein